jgi:hypothetical protein
MRLGRKRIKVDDRTAHERSFSLGDSDARRLPEPRAVSGSEQRSIPDAVGRPGNYLTHRFPLIVEALARLRSRSCIIDGAAVSCNDRGIATFDRIRYRRHDDTVFLYAFDLIELNGDDLRRDPLQVRKATSASVLAKVAAGICPVHAGCVV